MTLPAPWNLDIYRGDDFLERVWLKDQYGAYLNLTGWTGRAQLRDTSKVTLLATFTVVVPTQTGVALGAVDMKLTKAVTGPITQNVGVYDLEMTDAGTPTFTRTYIAGTANIAGEVTI